MNNDRNSATIYITVYQLITEFVFWQNMDGKVTLFTYLNMLSSLLQTSQGQGRDPFTGLSVPLDSLSCGPETRSIFRKGIKNGCPCIVEIRGTQGFALVGDPARAVCECRDVAKAQP